MHKYIQLTEESDCPEDGWMTDGSCGTHWVEPLDFHDLCCRESGYFTPDISSDSDVEEDMSSEDGRRAHTSMPTPPSPKSPSATPGKRLRDVIETQKTAVQAAVTISDDAWEAYANMLSPPTCNYRKPPRTSPNTPLVRPTRRFSFPEPRTVSDVKLDSVSEPDLDHTAGKPPLYPVTHNVMNPYEFQARGAHHTHIMIPCESCLCIACAGMKAKARCTPCLVCGESIPYSVCLKVLGARSHVPTICFKCNCAFLAKSQ
jgi:hypothetical protein